MFCGSLLWGCFLCCFACISWGCNRSFDFVFLPLHTHPVCLRTVMMQKWVLTSDPTFAPQPLSPREPTPSPPLTSLPLFSHSIPHAMRRSLLMASLFADCPGPPTTPSRFFSPQNSSSCGQGEWLQPGVIAQRRYCCHASACILGHASWVAEALNRDVAQAGDR